MPLFSIIIPSYKNGQYLDGCLDSLLSQGFQDWEAIVVDDGSPDSSSEIVEEYSSKDERFVLILKEQNEGTHKARMSGVEAAKGDYAFFLDADDELAPGALSGMASLVQDAPFPADMYHLGIDAINSGVGEDERISFESYINKPVEVLEGPEIIKSICSKAKGYVQDWRVTQRLYRTSLLKRAFASMTRDRLGRAQDGYEFFVIGSLATLQITRNDVIALRYYYGRGLNGSSAMSPLDFAKSAEAFQASIDAMRSYTEQFDRFPLASPYAGAKDKMLQLLWNDWYIRVPDEKKIEAARLAVPYLGEASVSQEVLRLSRDRSYSIYTGESDGLISEVEKWVSFAEGLLPIVELSPSAVISLYDAKSHIFNVRLKESMNEKRSQAMRIFVSAHKPVDLFNSAVLQPVQVGCSMRNDLFPWAWHDNDGENISDQNAMYCELTAQYWAWKNVDAEYYGFCHYRRYFNFSSNRYKENDWGEIIESLPIGTSTQRKYSLDDESVEAAIRDFDVVTTEAKDLSAFPGGNDTPIKQYAAAPKLRIDDLYHVFAIVEDMYPEYIPDVVAFANGHKSYFCNMFIMKKAIFRDYSQWLFSILERFVSEWDSSLHSKEGLRTPGHLAERLFNIYLLHAERVSAGWKRKEVQCVHFEYPDKRCFDLPPVPGYAELDKPVIPVVFAADNNYVPMLTTTIESMMRNASTDYFYDVVVVEDGISSENKQQMQGFFSKYPNMILRFFGAGALISGYDLTTSNEHISKETYYRFLIQDVLPYYGKVLYLDSDLIIEGDVSELYELELGDNLLAAAHDVDYMGNLNMPDAKRMEYTKEVLEMARPYDYFQAGVLVLNTTEMRKLHSVEEWLEIASNPDYIYNDQDILNAHCQGRVKYLGYEWNVMHDCGGRVGNVFSFAPASAFDSYNASRSNPKIIHYAGFEKPWILPECDFAEHYWKYARSTPFYEKLIALISKHKTTELHLLLEEEARPPKVVGENSRIRKVIDPIMPLGSRRREVAKAVGRKLRGRS